MSFVGLTGKMSRAARRQHPTDAPPRRLHFGVRPQVGNVRLCSSWHPYTRRRYLLVMAPTTYALSDAGREPDTHVSNTTGS